MTTTINASTSAGLVNTADTSGILQLQTAGTTALTIDTSQNVGIGTTTPGTKVQVFNSGSTDTRFSIGNSNAGFQVGVESTGACLIANFVAQPISMYTNGLERMRIDSSGNLQFNSGYGSTATAYGCRAWVNFNGGNGNTAGVINGSGNVSSITVNGTGDYTVNFTNAMPDANYAVFGCLKPPTAATSTNGKVLYVKWDTAPTTSAVRVTTNSTGGVENEQYCYVTIFR